MYFLQGIFRKPERGYQNDKKNLTTTKTTLEGSRGHHITMDPERLPGGAGQPHPNAAQSLVVGPACQLLEYSSTASLDCIYTVLQVGLI
jgi:hypothetical protein